MKTISPRILVVVCLAIALALVPRSARAQDVPDFSAALREGNRLLRDGEAENALEAFHRALVLAGDAPDRIASVRGRIGSALLRLERFDEARTNYELSLAYYEEIGHDFNRAVGRANLALVEHARGNLALANALLDEAQAIVDTMRENGGLDRMIAQVRERISG